MAEFLRPDADVSIGGWTPEPSGSLGAKIDETSPDDADYIKSGPDPSGDIFRFRLSNPSGAVVEPVTFRYRYEKSGSGTANLIARLIQGNASTTWNPSDLANLTLSNGNLTGTGLSAEYSGARSVASESTGLKYVELTLNTIDQILVGIANSALDLGGFFVGEDFNGIGWFSSGSVWINGTTVATVAAYAQGDTLCIAVNFDSEKIWFRVNGGDWNNDVIGNQNPATNTGGISFSSLNAGPYFVAMTLDEVGVVTANFGATAYDQTPPSGATNFGDEAVIAEWEHTDIAASFVTAEQTLTTPQFDSITDFYDLFGELEANVVVDSAAWTNYLARTTSLGEPYASAIQELLNGLTTDGLFNADGTSDYFDALYIYANQDTTNALLNLVSASYPCVANGSPAFAAGDGYTGEDAAVPTKFLNTQFNPATAGGKFTQNSCHASAWVHSDFTTVNGGVATGLVATDFSSTTLAIVPKQGTDVWGRATCDTQPTVATGTAAGFVCISRTASNVQKLYKNGAEVASNTVASVALVSGNIYVLSWGKPDAFGAYGFGGQVAAAGHGAGLTGTQNTNFYNRMRTYMTAVGVP